MVSKAMLAGEPSCSLPKFTTKLTIYQESHALGGLKKQLLKLQADRPCHWHMDLSS